MLIRLATIKDISPIIQLIGEVVPAMNAAANFQWDDAYPNAEVFKNDIFWGQLWIAEIEGAIAGISAITTNQEPEYVNVSWDITKTAIVTHRLAVSTKHRGKGIGAALLMQAEHEAIKRGINVLRIDTNTSNKATQQLFPKLGYRFSGETGLSFRPNLRFYCYEKILSEI